MKNPGPTVPPRNEQGNIVQIARRLTMKDEPKHERPRERLIDVGAAGLTDVELLAILISRGTSGVPVRDIAQRLVSTFGSLADVKKATVAELCKVRGIGPAKACQIVAAFEIARRGDDALMAKERPEMSDVSAVARIARRHLTEPAKESFFVAYLDSRNRMLGKDRVSVGSLDTTLAHPRDVFEKAIRANAAAVIVAHNHPSGDPHPSDDDIRLTRRLVEAGKILGIKVLDHVIVGGSEHYSFRQHALL